MDKNNRKASKKRENRKNKNMNTKNEDKSTFLKHCQSLPYHLDWPLMKKTNEALVLEELISVLTKKLCNQFLLKKRKKVQGRRSNTSSNEIKSILSQIAAKNVRFNNLNIDEEIASLDDTSYISDLTNYFVLGINSVTKYIENLGCLDLLLVCSSANPSEMTRHLLYHSYENGIVACSLNNLSDTVSSLFDVKSTLAIGFKIVDGNPFQELIDFIKGKVPSREELPENHISNFINVFHSCAKNEITVDDLSKDRTNKEHIDESDISIEVNPRKRNASILFQQPNVKMVPVKKKKTNKRKIT